MKKPVKRAKKPVKRAKKPTPAQIAQAGQMVVAYMANRRPDLPRLTPREIRSLLRHYVEHILYRAARDKINAKKRIKKKTKSTC
jgi:hypothetical protein